MSTAPNTPDGQSPVGPPPASSGSPERGGREFWYRPQILVAVIGGALTIVAATLGLAFDLFPDLKPDATSEVEVANFDVDHEKSIRADSTSVLGTEGATRRLTSSAVTVTLRNTGDNPALFTRATFRFSHSETTRCVSGGGDGSLHGLYGIKVPMNKKAPTVERKMRWDLPPHKQETMAFTVGPKDIVDRHTGIYQFTMVLSRDDGSTIELPSVGHVAPSENLKEYLEGARYVFNPATNDSEEYLSSQQRCWRRESANLTRITQSAKHISPELREFQRDLAAIISGRV